MITPSEEQKAFIGYDPTSNAVLMAGPGTGKSLVAAWMLERLCKDRPDLRVKMVTFARAATSELLGKLAGTNCNLDESRVTTFHSLVLSTLMKNAMLGLFPLPLRIADKYEQKKFINLIVAKAAGVSVRRASKLLTAVSLLQCDNHGTCFSGFTEDQIRHASYALGSACHVNRCVTLDGLAGLALQALRNSGFNLAAIDADVLVIDEYQDLNPTETQIVRHLADRGVCIVAIGDPDQSIYSFRGATPAALAMFESEYRAKSYALTVSQRLSPQNLAWGKHVIMQNTDCRVAPSLSCTSNPEFPGGDCRLLGFRSSAAEANATTILVQWLHYSQAIPWSEIAILYRRDGSGKIAATLQDELAAADVPVFAGGSDRVLEQAMSRQLIAHARLSVDLEDSLAWRTLLRLQPGIGSATLRSLDHEATERSVSFGKLSSSVTPSDLASLLGSSRGLLVADLLAAVKQKVQAMTASSGRAETGWGQWMLAMAGALSIGKPSVELESLLEQIDGQVVAVSPSLSTYLSMMQPTVDDMAVAVSDKVRIMTMTKSKGLTVRAAIIVGVEDELMPGSEPEAEERRLLYVAMTRAKQFLFLTWTASRQGPAAFAGRPNQGVRAFSRFLQGGPVFSEDGMAYVNALRAS